MKWTIDEDRVPTREEMRALVKAVRERADAARANGNRQAVVDWAVLHALVGTGLRSHELAALQVGDLRVGHGEASLIVKRGKGGKPRVVAISDRLTRHLRDFLRWKEGRGEPLAENGPVFASERVKAPGLDPGWTAGVPPARWLVEGADEVAHRRGP